MFSACSPLLVTVKQTRVAWKPAALFCKPVLIFSDWLDSLFFDSLLPEVLPPAGESDELSTSLTGSAVSDISKV